MAFRDFMAHFAPTWGSSPIERAALMPSWDALIETSLTILAESQCAATGLVPNWWVPSNGGSPAAGTTGCSGSGTPAAEFGSEASRTGWRLALGWLWYGDAQSGTYLRERGLHSAAAVDRLPRDVYTPDWIGLGFMLGPVASTLTVPPVSGAGAPQQATQQSALDLAAALLDAMPITSYYSGSWIAIATDYTPK
eukprot:2997692-Prymnesium_polylepis.1